MTETGGLGPVRFGGLTSTKVFVIGLIVVADLLVLGAVVALILWVL